MVETFYRRLKWRTEFIKVGFGCSLELERTTSHATSGIGNHVTACSRRSWSEIGYGRNLNVQHFDMKLMECRCWREAKGNGMDNSTWLSYQDQGVVPWRTQTLILGDWGRRQPKLSTAFRGSVVQIYCLATVESRPGVLRSITKLQVRVKKVALNLLSLTCVLFFFFFFGMLFSGFRGICRYQF